jgi:glutathione S-transferase
MQLYYAPDSIALASHIALAESGLDYSLVKVDHHIHVTEDGQSYFEINPNGYVPALKLPNGEIMTESVAILLYIADQAPERGLCPPAGDPARYRVLSWASFVATEIHQKFMRFTQPGLTPEQTTAILDLLTQRVVYADRRLDRGPWLDGDRPTIADIFLFVATGWFKYHQVPLSTWRNIERFRTAMGERPAVRKALAEEGLG